jgi:hypothetical protein
MRWLLLSLLVLSLGAIGCRHQHTHTAGVCDCYDRGMYHDTPRHESAHSFGHIPVHAHGTNGSATIDMPREMPKAK